MSSEDPNQSSKTSKNQSKSSQRQKNNPQPEKKENNPEEEKENYQSKFNFIEMSKYSATSDELNDDSSSRNIIFIGSKNSGKSSLINGIISCDSASFSRGDATSSGPTKGINYNYIKLPSKKKIINLYEIGGGIESFNLIKEILLPQHIQNSLLFIILDFGKPKSALENLLEYLKEINKYIEYIKGYQSGGIKGADELNDILIKKTHIF